MRTGIYMGCVGVLVGASALWFLSYQWNSKLIVDTNSQVNHIEAMIGAESLDFESDVISAVDTLDKIMMLPLGKNSEYGHSDAVKSLVCIKVTKFLKQQITRIQMLFLNTLLLCCQRVWSRKWKRISSIVNTYTRR